MLYGFIGKREKRAVFYYFPGLFALSHINGYVFYSGLNEEDQRQGCSVATDLFI